MDTQRYPIGIQSFPKLIEGGYTYVDKTRFVGLLAQRPGYYFLSRPRRFGKSLLLSTLHAYFEGQRELFKGLDIDSMDVDWTSHPVLHFDLNAENYSEEQGLTRLLDVFLREYEVYYGRHADDITPAQRFRSLIRNAYEKTGIKVVILVDEYDKPLLGIEENPSLFSKTQNILKAFLGVLKSMDSYIHFAMLTGVARFNKVSIFSDLNNLDDISLSNRFADICGWTQSELEETFHDGIESLASEIGMSYVETVDKLKTFYDGYLFAPKGNRLYNPFSVLNALNQRSLKYFWFQTGTPTFLVRRVQKSGIVLPSLNHCRAYETQLLSVGITDTNPIPLLFQTGYLTIKETDGEIYTLEFPNKEVEIGFARHLQPLFVPQMNNLDGPFSVVEFQRELIEGQPERFMSRLSTMVKDIPYEQHDEKLYQNIVYLLFTLIGADVRVEEHTNLGRPDIVVRTKEFVYIFEFKFNKSASEAMSQIHDRDYAGRHNISGRKVFLIGANFSDSPEIRGLSDYLIETL